MKMTPEHHAAVAAVFAQSDEHDRLERRLRWQIAQGRGWVPDTCGWRLCTFCTTISDGHVANMPLCTPCLWAHAGPRWAVIAMLRTPAVGENV